ncbi:hypothetical protein JTB14_030299 [Gonioctena quinquepunctata]|nr:hypothetical protein JTB14_030299 [Gonioctena quinquepunctata]
MGHFSRVCRSSNWKSKPIPSAATLATISAASPKSLTKAVLHSEVNGSETEALVDTYPADVSEVAMASTSLHTKRTIYDIIERENPEKTYAYLDEVTYVEGIKWITMRI